jgi:hypothetical protein
MPAAEGPLPREGVVSQSSQIDRGLESAAVRLYCRGMRLQIEFFRRTEEAPDGLVVRRNSGRFASERDAEIYGLTGRPDDVDGFRILKDGALRKTVPIRTET